MLAGCTHKLKQIVVNDEGLFKDLEVMKVKQGELNSMKD